MATATQDTDPISLATTTLSPAQAAARIGTSVATLEAWRAAGRGPMYVELPDHVVRYRSSDLHHWAAQFAGS